MAIDVNSLEYQWNARAGGGGAPVTSIYSVNFSSGGKDYTFIPDSVINKGVKSGDNTYVMPWFLNKDNLGQLGQVGQKVDLAGKSWYGDWLQNNIGASTTGFLVPSGSIPFDTNVHTIPASQGEVQGIAEKGGQLVYKQDSGGNISRYFGADGVMHTISEGRSWLGETFGDLGDATADFINSDIGKIAITAAVMYAGGTFDPSSAAATGGEVAGSAAAEEAATSAATEQAVSSAATDYSITSGTQAQAYLANTGEGLTMSGVTGQTPNLAAMGGAQGLIAAEGSVLGDPTSFINNAAYVPADVVANPGTISEAGVTAANATPSLGDPASFVNGGTSSTESNSVAEPSADGEASLSDIASAASLGTTLVSAASADTPAAPAYDGGVGAAALANVELGKDWLTFAKEQYAEGNKRQAATDALNTKVINQQLATQDQANTWAQEDRSRTKSLFQPVEDALVKTANEFDTPDRQDQASAQAKADVMTNAAVQKQASARQMASMGVSPVSGRFASLNRANDTNTALASSSAQTSARNLIRDKGLALKADAVNIGKGLPSSTAAAFGIGVNAGNSAVANNASGNQNFNQNSNVMNTGYSGAIGANNSAGSMLGNLYGNQLNAWSAQQQANATSSAGLGSLVGTGIGAFAAL